MRPLCEWAPAIYEMALGSDHPNVGLTHGNLGSLKIDEGRPSEAPALAQSALAAHDKALDPWTKSSARVTAAALGRGEEAKAVRARYALERPG